MAFDSESVTPLLQGRTLLWLEQTDSTMLDAARFAALGCLSGTVVGADLQTAGQGRHGRSWDSPEGLGLYFSVVLRLSLPPSQLPMVTMAAGLAVAEAITQHNGIAVDLRWPNDVMIGDRKLAGILIQQHQDSLICGIGINVNQVRFPPDLAPIATSLRIASGKEHAREPMLLVILASLDEHLGLLASQGPAAILRLFSQASSYVSGRRVIVEHGGSELRGITEGLDEYGFLRLRLDDGALTTVLAGGVRPA